LEATSVRRQICHARIAKLVTIVQDLLQDMTQTASIAQLASRSQTQPYVLRVQRDFTKLKQVKRLALAAYLVKRKTQLVKRSVKIVTLVSIWLARNQQTQSATTVSTAGTKIRKDNQIAKTAVKANGAIATELQQIPRVPIAVQENTHPPLLLHMKWLAMVVHLEKLQVKKAIRKHLIVFHAFQTRTPVCRALLRAHRVMTPNFRW